jgi:hypothetical protein
MTSPAKYIMELRLVFGVVDNVKDRIFQSVDFQSL